MPTVFVTGAGRGIGLEFARQYAADGWRVIATVRDASKAADLKDVAPKAEIHALDVTNHAAIAELGRALAKETIDVAIANAGVALARGMTPQEIDEEAWLQTFRVNTIAPFAMAGALMNSVKRSSGKCMIAITSRMGSIAENSGGSYAYRSSKTALNMVWRGLAAEQRDLIAVVLHPGWVKTDMGGLSAPVRPKDSVAGMRRVIERLTARDSGKFFDFEGAEIPW